jgi:hypothetical protein
VTGWQSGGGDQGGWNPNQSFGPEAQTNRYNDPYANQDPYNYGTDPYPGLQDQYPQYGTDPYGQYQQQYPPTGGFPAPGYGPPPPPPKRSKLPMILSLVAIVIIIGAVVAIVLVNRNGDQPVAQNNGKTSSSAPQKDTSSKSKKPTSTSSAGGGDHGDWIAIDNTADSTLSYQVPPDWQKSDTPIDSGQGVKFTGVGAYGVYDCEGANYTRTFAASGDVQGKNGKDLDLATTVQDFAKSFAKVGYGDGVQVDVPQPTEVKVGDKTGMALTAKVTVTVTKPNCQASEAEVGIVGVPVQAQGQPKGVAMLVVVNDLKGGPADPKTLDTSVTQEILGTVKAG